MNKIYIFTLTDKGKKERNKWTRLIQGFFPLKS